MKNFKNIMKAVVATACVGAATTSCSLELIPLNDVVLESYWTDKSDVESVVLSCYTGMQSNGYITKALLWGESRADNVVENTTTPVYLKSLMKGDIKSTSDATNWASYYTVINRCNTVLKYAEDVAKKDPNYTEFDLNVTKAECRTLRAISYLTLIKSFKDVPFTYEPSIDDTQDYLIPASSFENILDSLILDVEEVANNNWAPISYSDESKNTGRITRASVNALLCELYLWKASYPQQGSDQFNITKTSDQIMDAYKKSMDYGKKVIDYKIEQYKENKNGSVQNNCDAYVYRTYGYPLIWEEKENRTFNAATNIFINGASFESIFELTYMKSTSDAYIKNTDVGNFYDVTDDNGKRTHDVSAQGEMVPDESKLSDTYSDQSLFSTFSDSRMLTSFLYVSGDQKFDVLKYVGYPMDGTVGASQSEFKASTTTATRTVKGSNEPWIIYRLSDIMLMRAEAAIQIAHLLDVADEVPTEGGSGITFKGATSTSKLATAKDYYDEAFYAIRAVYERSNYKAQEKESLAPQMPTTYKDFVELCEMERRRELLFEGKRMYDVVRRCRREASTDHFRASFGSKMSGATASIKMNNMDFMYMPINKSQLKVNPNLKQNSAYADEEEKNTKN